MERSPGQDIRYVVVDDKKISRERVRLSFEADDYDPEFYAEELRRAAMSVISPLGCVRERLDQYLRDSRDMRLSAYS